MFSIHRIHSTYQLVVTQYTKLVQFFTSSYIYWVVVVVRLSQPSPDHEGQDWNIRRRSNIRIRSYWK